MYIRIESIYLSAQTPSHGDYFQAKCSLRPPHASPRTETLATPTLSRIFYVICILSLMSLYTNIVFFFFLAIFHTTKFSFYLSACSVVHQGSNSCKYLGLSFQKI